MEEERKPSLLIRYVARTCMPVPHSGMCRDQKETRGLETTMQGAEEPKR